jgi:transcriptional regulator with XRE-family HTH domain
MPAYRPSRGVRVPQLRFYRERLALSQQDLADKAGVGRSTVARGEHDEEIRVSSVRRLARALRVTPQQLQEPRAE